MTPPKEYAKELVVCERCEKTATETWPCERCEQMICDDCTVKYDQFSQVDYTLCKSCRNVDTADAY